MRSALLLLVLLVVAAHAYVLPGTRPQEYNRGDRIELKVGQLDSVRTQVPFEYYQLPFCKPEVIEQSAENLGEVMSGDVIQNSIYEVNTKVVESCKILCKRDYTAAELAVFADKIDDDYRVHWMLDNLPAATKYYVEIVDTANPSASPVYQPRYEKGFSLGFVGSEKIPRTTPGTMYINNHVRLTVHVHEDAALFAGFRVVGFEVEPFSVRHSFDGAWAGKATQLNTCNPLNKVTHELPPQPVSDVSSIVFTYDIQFQNSDIRWASRWDMYLKMSDPRIHWFSIVNSFVIVLFLSAMIAMIMVRTLHRDLLRYNTVAEDREAAEEETGWKLVHGDVFRAPQNGGFLCILTGAGAQIIGMTCLTISFAALGLLSPANRGALMTAFLVLFALMGSVAGYTSARFYKIMELTEWRSNTLWTSLLFPGAAFAVFFVLNLVMWAQKSSAAVPFVTLLALLVLWFGISVPLVYLGAYFGYRTETKLPVKVMPIPRLVPDQPAYMSPLFGILVGGVLPFGAIFIEVFFIMSSVWHHQYFYMFGFLLLVLVILIITCAEITIVMTYFQLCSEDYHWWWRSFLTAGSSAIYLFAYSILYFFTKLSIVKFLSAVLFFGYMFLVSFAFFLLTGAIGFVSCWIFVTKIYGAVKVD